MHVVHDSGVRYVLIQGIRSERSLTRITRAVAFRRAERAEVLEFGDEGQGHLLAHVGHLQLAGDQA